MYLVLFEPNEHIYLVVDEYEIKNILPFAKCVDFVPSASFCNVPEIFCNYEPTRVMSSTVDPVT